jgi:hypothetical protein
MHLLHKNLVQKTSAAHAVLVVTPALPAIVHQPVALVAPPAPMPHRRMAAINPLKPPMLPKPPSSASAR